MPYVITEKCLGERYASCVAVCPVDCCIPDEFAVESKEELAAKKAKLHILSGL